jgi:hypothetical protein
MKRYLCCAAVVSVLLVALPAFAGKNDATVTVMNESSYELTAVYYCAAGEYDWGDSFLPAGARIRAGKQRDVVVPSGSATMIAVFDVDGNEVSVTEEAEFEARATYEWTLTDDMIWESYGGGGDSYGYYDDSYGYYDPYYDTYGYYDDTYGYYDENYGY